MMALKPTFSKTGTVTAGKFNFFNFQIIFKFYKKIIKANASKIDDAGIALGIKFWNLIKNILT